MIDIFVEGLKFGAAQVAEEVISAIAAAAALEVEGVASLGAQAIGGYAEAFGVKLPPKAVKVAVASGEATIEVSVTVKFGVKVQDVAKAVQKRVAMALETMTGLKAVCVDVLVTGVTPEPETGGRKLQRPTAPTDRHKRAPAAKTGKPGK